MPHGLADPILGRGGQVGMVEFRADGHASVLDYAGLCGGRGSYTYPQHELVADWADRAGIGRLCLRNHVTDRRRRRRLW